MKKLTKFSFKHFCIVIFVLLLLKINRKEHISNMTQLIQTDFKQRTKELLQDEYDAFDKSLEMTPPVSIRFNRHKLATENAANIQETIPWCKTGFYLSERPSFTFDPLFHAGTYYVQEASSMFLEQAINRILADEAGQITALDLCAAPGGKSTHLLTLLPEGSLLVSNEVIRSRCMILAENIAKWGMPDNIVTNNDPKDFGRLTHLFDIIVTDLPCSGEGMFRKDKASRDEWSVDNVKLCAARQRRIIHDSWNALKPGGWLIYSTCTFNTEENEDNIYTLAQELGAEIIPINTEKEWNIVDMLRPNIPAYRFFPHRTKGEGFFLALLQKHPAHADIIKTKPKNNDKQPVIPEKIKHFLSEPEKFSFLSQKKSFSKNSQESHKKPQETATIYAIPTAHKSIYDILTGHLNIISAGIFMGETKGDDFIPSTQLALSIALQRDKFISVDLPYPQAIKYLQKESITLPEATPKGYVLITYKNIPLGFAKNIGPRTNNLYPQEWRIRKREGGVARFNDLTI